MTAKHTPGPWKLSEMHAEGFYMNDGAASIVAEGGRVALADVQCKVKRGQGYKAQCPERDANAALIAAAPEMHDALSLAEDLLARLLDSDHGGTPEELAILEAVRAALAKADGRTS